MKKQIMALAMIFTLGTGAFTTDTLAAEHKIKKGETLSEISKQYSMTVEDVKNLNDLTSNLIIANEILSVLDENDFYTIQKGDTLFEIGQAKSATVDQLMEWNNLSTEIIFAGDILAVTLEAGKQLMKEQATQPAEQKTKANSEAKTKTNSEAKTNTTTQSKANLETKTQEQEKSTLSQQESKSEPAQEAKPAENEEKTLTMTATAYTAFCEGCSGITANGTDLRANPNLKVIAVDTNIIPLGTKVWVEGYGEAIAADTGGAIKGNKIDLFMASESDATNWGRKTVQVKILN